MDAPEQEAPADMNGMQMGQDMMQGGVEQHQGMMQMMMQCMGMMEQMHGEDGTRGEGMGGMNSMGGMGMMPGMMGDQAASPFDEATAEALARAFVVGQQGNDAAPVEIVDVALDGGNYVVEYQQDGAEGTVLVNAETGDVTEADNR